MYINYVYVNKGHLTLIFDLTKGFTPLYCSESRWMVPGTVSVDD